MTRARIVIIGVVLSLSVTTVSFAGQDGGHRSGRAVERSERRPFAVERGNMIQQRGALERRTTFERGLAPRRGIAIDRRIARDRRIAISRAGERRLIHGYYATGALPPGLAKRRRLPPGLQKHLRERGQLPPGLQKRLTSSPFPLLPW